MDEPQQIVSTRKLYCLQSHDLNTSRLLAMVWPFKKSNIIKKDFTPMIQRSKGLFYKHS